MDGVVEISQEGKEDFQKGWRRRIREVKGTPVRYKITKPKGREYVKH